MNQLDRDEAQNVEDAALFDRFAPAIFGYLYGQIVLFDTYPRQNVLLREKPSHLLASPLMDSSVRKNVW